MKNSKGFEENLYYSQKNNSANNCGEGWIRCLSGVYINVLDPNPEHLLIEDIAHALSMIPRFGGQTQYKISIADHCLNGIFYKDKELSIKDKLSFLMHDASEAYLLDIPSPIKKLFPRYYEIENNFMKILSNKFGFEYPLNENIKKLDVEMLEIEWHVYMINGGILLNRDNSKLSFIQQFNYLKFLL